MREKWAVCVIDDDASVRRALCMTLKSANLHTKEYSSAEDFLAEGADEEAGCLVLDLRLLGMSGLELLQRLRNQGVRMPVIMITGHGGVQAAVASMKLGAVDFLEKPVDPWMLMEKATAAIRQHEERMARESETADAKSRMAEITTREQELLKLLAVGRSTKQIAMELGISFKTVENHRTHLLGKAKAENMAALIRLATLAGLV